MNNSGLRAMDIALATEARAMYAHLLTQEDKDKIASLRSPDELVAFLGRCEAWHPASLALPAVGATIEQFSEALSRCVYDDYERLYRFANDVSRDFLIFISYELELRAILSALRRLSDSTVGEHEPAPAQVVRLMRNLDLERLRTAHNYEDIKLAARGSLYAQVLASLELDPKTGLPNPSAAVIQLTAHFYRVLSRYLNHSYRGPAKRELLRTVSFRTDMLNISYLLRLRRFGVTREEAGNLLLPVDGSLGPQTERRILEAETDEEAMAEIRASRLGKWLTGIDAASPEQLVRAAEAAFYRKVIHGTPNLCVVDAFLTLKRNEANMLRRAFVALQYGLSPANFML